MRDVDAIAALVVLAIIVAALAPRLRLPAPSILVLVGLGVGFVPGVEALHPTPELMTLGVLPPLLFAAAQQISLLDLRQVWRPVAVLAFGLVMVSAAAVAAVTQAVVPGMSLAVAFTFGAVLASTDPVAVTALSRELRLPPRVATLVQAESLFNDATSLVLFEVAVAAAVGSHVGTGNAVGRFVVLAAGGTAAGVITGWLAGLALRRAHDPTVQAAIALATPYVAAIAAQTTHVSPVTAVIVAGLMLGRRRARARHSEGRLLAGSVYEVVVFVLENAVFAVIGLQLATFMRGLYRDEAGTTAVLVVVVAVTLLAVRAIALAAPRRQWKTTAVMTWAGARGVIPLVAALAIPTQTDGGAPFPHRAMLLVAATAVVVVTLVVQGTTLAPLVRRLGVSTPPAALREELQRAERALALAALDSVDRLAESVDADDEAADSVRAELRRRAESAREPVGHGSPDALKQLRRELLDVEAAELARLRVAGEISAATFQQLQRRLDIEHSRLADQ